MLRARSSALRDSESRSILSRDFHEPVATKLGCLEPGPLGNGNLLDVDGIGLWYTEYVGCSGDSATGEIDDGRQALMARRHRHDLLYLPWRDWGSAGPGAGG